MRRVLALALAVTTSGCGLIIDGAYLLSGKTEIKHEEQHRPTGQVERALEHDLVLSAATATSRPDVQLRCQSVEHGIDHVWSVQKTYENQGGWYQVHWLPVALEGLIGGALAIGVTVTCTRADTPTDCSLLYGTIPFGVDVLYSAIRLATIDPPKLVDKQRTNVHTEPRTDAVSRSTVACEPDARLMVGRSAEDPLAVQVRVDALGLVQPADVQRLVTALASQPEARLWWLTGTAGPGASGHTRCEALQTLTGRPGPGCQPPAPTAPPR
jgi:hypothetical protein